MPSQRDALAEVSRQCSRDTSANLGMIFVKHINYDKACHVILVDLSRANDKIYHTILSTKLKTMVLMAPLLSGLWISYKRREAVCYTERRALCGNMRTFWCSPG